MALIFIRMSKRRFLRGPGGSESSVEIISASSLGLGCVKVGCTKWCTVKDMHSIMIYNMHNAYNTYRQCIQKVNICVYKKNIYIYTYDIHTPKVHVLVCRY